MLALVGIEIYSLLEDVHIQDVICWYRRCIVRGSVIYAVVLLVQVNQHF